MLAEKGLSEDDIVADFESFKKPSHFAENSTH